MRPLLARTAVAAAARLRLAPLVRVATPAFARRVPVVVGRRYTAQAQALKPEEERKWSTPLAKQLAEAIAATGPMPLATFMRMCLTSDTGGYYTGALEADRDQFGRKGDFITSPEISQVFGELVGIWFVAEWMSQGRPREGVEIIEVGPGRGTLMDDMLRTISNFPDMAHAIDAIYMVEASPELREAQIKLLCGEDASMTESRVGSHSICKKTRLPIVWTETIKSLPTGTDKMPLIVAHEFFDALPIHAFQCVEVPASRLSQKNAAEAAAKAAAAGSSPEGSPADADSKPNYSAPSTTTTKTTLQWRELLVTPTPPGSTHASLGTPAAEQSSYPPPDFQLSLSRTHTRHSLHLPGLSARYRPLLSRAGNTIEISPDLSLYVSDFARRIGGSAAHPKSQPRGAALILDYGPADSVPANSLRGIQRHHRVSPFTDPGRADVSADVDFGAVAEAATRASVGVEVHGPVEQADFLEAMGGGERVARLVAGADDGERAKGIEGAWRRLVDKSPVGMGKVYKAIAILPENEGRRRPVGFGGDLEA